MSKREKKHFVLVHGACHGGWCWYKVVTLLKSEGHNVTSLDLAASGVNPKQIHEIRSISEYYEPLMDFMDSLPPLHKVVLVAHSLAGVAISVAMERFTHKISLAVFVSATMPSEQLPYPTLAQEVNRRIDSFMDTHFTFGHGPDKPPTARLFGPKFLESKLYQLSPPEKHKSPSKDMEGFLVFIICDKDKILQEDLQRWMIERNPPLQVKVIAGSDHMPMFSKPLELCTLLLEFADMY